MKTQAPENTALSCSLYCSIVCTESIDFILDSSKDLADKEFFPYYQEMDKKPAVYKDGEIIVHPQVKNVIKKSAELGLLGATFEHQRNSLDFVFEAGILKIFIWPRYPLHTLD